MKKIHCSFFSSSSFFSSFFFLFFFLPHRLINVGISSNIKRYSPQNVYQQLYCFSYFKARKSKIVNPVSAVGETKKGGLLASLLWEFLRKGYLSCGDQTIVLSKQRPVQNNNDIFGLGIWQTHEQTTISQYYTIYPIGTVYIYHHF